MRRTKEIALVAAGILIGTVVGAPDATAALSAEPSTNRFFVDGVETKLEAYLINGNNYVKLRDVGKVVDFNVYWDEEDRTVQIESGKPYTGVAPEDDPLDENMDIRPEIVRLANEERKKAGLRELPVNDALMDAAQDCSEQGFTDHDPKYDCETAAAYGYEYGFLSNLAILLNASDDDTAARAVNCWTGSSNHYKTIMDPKADAIGVGVAVIGNTTYCFMLVGDSTSFNPYA